MPGKFGRLPRDTTRFAPALEDYLRTHPKTGATGLEHVADSEDVDRASKVTTWPLYCNGDGDPGNPPASPDGIGDCTIAEMGHAFTALGVYAGKPQVLFDDAAIIQAYSDVSGYDPQTGNNDNGCQMQDVLAYCRTTGIPDTAGNVHKVLAYAALRNPGDITLLSRVLKTFGYAYIGIDCPASAQDEFGQSPWTYVPGSPILGGHAIGLHRRQPYGSRVGVFDMASWGALQPATISFLTHYVTEAWCVVTQDWIEANGSSCDGISLSQLEADMRLV